MSNVRVLRRVMKLSACVDVCTILFKVPMVPGIVQQHARSTPIVPNGTHLQCVRITNVLTRAIQSTQYHHSQHQHCLQFASLMTIALAHLPVMATPDPVFVNTRTNGTELNGLVFRVVSRMLSAQLTWFATMETVLIKSRLAVFVKPMTIASLTLFAILTPGSAFVKAKSFGLAINGAAEQLTHLHL